MIEKGRHQKPITPRDNRRCPFCPTEIENEVHFLTKCIAYNRDPLYRLIKNTVPNFGNLNSEQQFCYLMSQEDKHLTYQIIYTIQYWLKIRKEIDTNVIPNGIGQGIP